MDEAFWSKLFFLDRSKITYYDIDKNYFYFPIRFTKCISQQNIIEHTIKIIITKEEECLKCFP